MFMYVCMFMYMFDALGCTRLSVKGGIKSQNKTKFNIIGLYLKVYRAQYKFNKTTLCRHWIF